MLEIIVVKLHISCFLSEHLSDVWMNFIEISFTFQSSKLKSTAHLHLSVVFLFYASKVELKFNPKSIFSSYRTFYLKAAEQMPPHILR